MGNSATASSSSSSSLSIEAPESSVSRREKICSEILATEETYIRGLTTLDRYYRTALLQAGEKEKTIAAIFSSVPAILGLHYSQVLPQLQSRCTPQAPAKQRWCVAQVFLDFSAQLGLYSVFVNNYDAAIKRVMKIRNEKKEVAQLFDNAKVLQECNGLDFFSLFITIVQRLPRYLLLLQDLQKHVPPSDKEHKLLSQAITLISTAAQEINERKAAFEDMNELGRLVADIASLPVKLDKPGRRIVESAEVMARHNPSSPFRPCKYWLFNDSILFARQQQALIGKFSKPWKLTHFSFLSKTEFLDARKDNVITIEAANSKPLQVQVSNAAEWISKLYLARSRAPKKLSAASAHSQTLSTPVIPIDPQLEPPSCQCLLQ